MVSQPVDGTIPSKSEAPDDTKKGSYVCTVDQIKQRLESIKAQKEQLKLAEEGNEEAVAAVRKDCLHQQRFLDLPIDTLDGWFAADLEAAGLIEEEEDALSQAEIDELKIKIYGEEEKSGEVSDGDVKEFIQSEKVSLDRQEAEERARLAKAETNGGFLTFEMSDQVDEEALDA